MRAYPNYWSAVSGRIEEGTAPEQQASQEILEETNLPAIHAFTAEPFALCDPSGKSFCVHPFRFVTDDSAPQLNVENIEYAWATKLPEKETVPALGESLRRARGGQRHWLSSTLKDALLRWRNDQENGAVELALQAARLLASCAQEYPAETHESRICMIRGAAIQMVKSHPDMPIIERVLGYILRGLRVGGVSGAQDAAREREEKLQLAREQAAQNAAELLYRALQREPHPNPGWLTLSASSTVHRCFEILSKRLPAPHLRILESRPLGEGVSLAKKLSNSGHRVSLYPDLAMPQALEGCLGVLLGADAIFSSGAVRNKIGSGLLAKVAHQRGLPVYIIADTWKITGEPPQAGKQLFGESAVQGGGELSQNVPLFELIQWSTITNIITEEGPLDARRLEKLSERRSLWSKQPYLLWGENFQEP
jgi:translation initiation factor 2B subunit (eIF-2B alpha/beta/delta family)/ADP-ribose pyrophosphatase YjhB (NUDIX family)